ncbi:unnamed protein product [Penicillium viridicatum]
MVNMAHDPKPSRSGVGYAVTKGKPRPKKPSAISPSARSTVSTSNVVREALSPAAKPRKGQGHRVTKAVRTKDNKATHQKCFDLMATVESEFQSTLEGIKGEMANEARSMERLQAEKAQETSKLEQALIIRDQTLGEKRRLEKELCQAQQQLGSLDATMQDQIPWNDIQPVLREMHSQLVAATTRFWNSINAFQSGRLGSYLPGSGELHGNWSEEGLLGSLGHGTLPGFSATSGYPPVAQVKAPTNEFGSLCGGGDI